MSPSPCDETSADCINMDGNFTCECRPGYTGYGLQCTGMDLNINWIIYEWIHA